MTNPGTTSEDDIRQKITDICSENGRVTKPMVDKLTKLISIRETKAREQAKQEFRDKFMIDPTKKYNVTGTEKAVIIELAQLNTEKGNTDE